MREKQIEHALVMAVKAAGGMCPKLVSPGTDGMPDRMILLPKGHIGFVEVKAPGKKPRPLQERRHKQPGRAGEDSGDPEGGGQWHTCLRWRVEQQLFFA